MMHILFLAMMKKEMNMTKWQSQKWIWKNKKSKAKTEREDYGDIYEKFTKEGMNSMFGKFLIQRKIIRKGIVK